MSDARLSPFCRWEVKDDCIEILTPDALLRLNPRTEGLLEQISSNSFSGQIAKELEQLGAITRRISPAGELLYKLDNYFQKLDIDVQLLRKGETATGVPLFKPGYAATSAELPGLGSFGQDSDRETAMLKAVVELYERYSCSPEINAGLMQENEPSELSQLIKFAPWQYELPEFPFSAEPSGRCITAHGNSKSIEVPAELVCFYWPAGGQICGRASSNGVAAFPDQQTAQQLAFYELIERDALMVHWFNKISRPAIKPPSEFKARLELLAEGGFSITLVDLTLDSIPVVLAIMQRQSRRYPRLLLGLGAHPDPIAACDKALQEVEVNATYADVKIRRLRTAVDVKAVMDHQYWYDQPRNHPPVLALWDGKQGGLPEGCTASHPLYTIELNRTGREETGIHVFRAIVPGLTPIGFGYRLEPLGMDRLSSLPSRIGLIANSKRRTKKHYLPQPFA